METKKKIRKHVPTSSSSSEDDSSSSSSSSSDTHRKKHRAGVKKQRDSSSSSDGEFVRKSHKHQHKKSSVRKHSHSAKLRAKMLQTNVKKARSMSPNTRAAHKHHLKTKLAKKAKIMEEQDRHSARRSRSPVRRDVKKERTPEHRINSPTTRIRVSVPNNRVQDRAAMRSVKDSPSTSRRYVRETVEDRGDIMMRQKEHEKMRRIQDEEHYKYSSKVGDRPSRAIPSTRTPDKYHRERSRSHGRVPIRERLDKDYEYRRSDSREHDEYPMARNSGNNPREMDRPYEYRSDDRRIPSHEYGQASRNYDERHHRWEDNRGGDPEIRGNRMYEGNSGGNKNWEPPIHDRKRILDDAPYKERQWNDNSGPHDKWAHKDKDPQEWKRGNWKDQSGPNVPTMPHARRWPGPNQMSSDNWNPRGPPPPHKMDSHSSSGPPFKPRGNAPFFGYKRFPYKRFPNQYSKINFPSKRVLPSASSTALSMEKHDDLSKGMGESLDNNSKFSSDQQMDSVGNESGELTTEAEEEKIAQPDTTFSGLTDAQYQEECEGNLSEFSDVDDDILNREEIEENSSSHMDVQSKSQSSYRTTSTASRAHNRIAYVNNRIFSPFSSDYYCIYGLLPRHADDDGKCELARASAQENQQSTDQSHNQIQNDQVSEEQAQDENEQKMISKIHANKELKKEMDLDFEEISDGELEQESAIKGFGDALGVDWASLAKETQRPVNKSCEEFYNSTKSRWTAHRILWDIGVSVKFAGEDFARKTLMEARDKLRDEKIEWQMKKNEQLRNEKMALNGDINIKKEKLDDINIKMEAEEDEEEQKNFEHDEQEDFELGNDVLLHPLAQVQVLMRKIALKRKNLILHSTGKYGRALSARKDLKLRRQLCNLPSKDLLIDRSCTTNPEIIKRADEIYRKLVDGVN